MCWWIISQFQWLIICAITTCDADRSPILESQGCVVIIPSTAIRGRLRELVGDFETTCCDTITNVFELKFYNHNSVHYKELQ